MSNYPTIRNPLLPSPPMASSRSRFKKSDLLSNLSLSTTATLSSSISTASIRSFMSQTMSQISNASTTLRIGHNRRIMPHSGSSQIMPKSATEKTLSTKKTAKNTDNEPLVHYNGPFHTLESLPVEKLNWIKDEQTSTLVKNPLTNYTKSIVLRKPLTRSQTYPALASNAYSRPSQTKPKGMFYLRVLQVIATDTSKTRLFRCGVQINQETCLSSYVTSEKTGKHSSIAHDVDDQTTATISIYAQNKGSSLFQSRHQKQEICLGKETIRIALHPKSKTTERFVLNSNPNAGLSNDIQLLVVHGTFVSRRTQNMLNNTILFEDFITAYVHTGMVPRWDRFWGMLRGVQFELYDFEYKQASNRPPLYIIPLDHFISAFDPSEEDGEEVRIDIGARGIALQFTENAISKSKRDWVADDLECRMYLLPESSAAAREWESKFNYVASIFDEVRGWDTNSSNDSYHGNTSDTDTYSYDDQDEDDNDGDDEDDEAVSVPLKLLW
ncbi:hypothetical protein MAM1_0273d09067 [Mucor ambiguus]|uniref:PH domain-containing protein n=1 Tax=Mucor ambiguus TaxID=91626 RepID=A0A0C9N0U3_9FUNG|nr:hypothetical protein MAM1_0273d09067 [Mucor ambiguus]